MQFTKGVKDKILEIVMTDLQQNGCDVLHKSMFIFCFVMVVL